VTDSSLPCLVWGCNPSAQIEFAWLTCLLGNMQHVQAWHSTETQLTVTPPVVLVESGILFLERFPSEDRIKALRNARTHRINQLAKITNFGLIHLSDEQGFDGDQLYPELPQGTVVWRNFHYPRFQSSSFINFFPIGPRVELLKVNSTINSLLSASKRQFPWVFMGTLWSSGTRTLAASLFLRALPKGFFFAGKRFGQGLEPSVYREHLLSSAFSLCPEGDRHFDTFRLYESLQAGCIPVIVDQRSMAIVLFGSNTVLPIFTSWPEALEWVQFLLANPEQLDRQQEKLKLWWNMHKQSLAYRMRKSLLGTTV